MKSAILAAAAASTLLLRNVSASAQAPAWGQCGGIGWTGPTVCTGDFYCVYSNPYFSLCQPIVTSTTTADPLPTTSAE